MSTLDNTPKETPAQAETETAKDSKLLAMPFQPGAGTSAAFDAFIADGKCSVRVEFGSYAMGIARGHYTALLAMLEGEDAVATIVQQPWGREGELTLCIHVPDAGQHESVKTKIDQTLAAIEGTPKGPVTVAMGPE